MTKIILTVAFLAINLYAGLVNAIAITVNETPITLFDIDKEVVSKKISQDKAVSQLIDAILYEQELKKNRISVDIFDVDNYIEKLAASNNMNVLDFKTLVRQQQNYTIFREKIKKTIITSKTYCQNCWWKTKNCNTR